MHSDVIIIGGGLIGACCADALTLQGLDVTLLERSFPASGSSRACDGLILLWDKSPGPELELGKHSVSLWEQLVPQLGADIEFRKSGTLLVNEGQASLEESMKFLEGIRAEEIGAEPLDGPALRKLEPALAAHLAGGAYFPDDYQVDPRKATLAILKKARQQGLKVRMGEDVIGLKPPGSMGGGWQVTTKKNSYGADQLVIATGVWSAALIQQLGVEIPVRPRKGHILVIKSEPDMLHHPLLEGGYEATVHGGNDELQIALVAEMTPAGTLLVGSSRQFVGFDTSISWEVLQALAKRAVRFIPALAGAQLIRSYAGLRPWSPDHLPLIGPVGELERLYLATGHEGAGICLAPITGELIAKWILGSELPSYSNAVNPRRFLGQEL